MWVDVQQNTPEWHDLRIGRITSSNFDKIMANEGKAFGNPAIKYARKKALERVTGLIDDTDNFTNIYMDRGNEFEPVAIEKYEIQTLNIVTNGGFNYWDLIGDSPDGNVGPNGCCEVKTVIANTQFERLEKGGYDKSYKWQIQGHLMPKEKEWCDFISFCPEMPADKQVYVYRVYKDDDMQRRLMERIDEFDKEIHSRVLILDK